MARQPSTRKRRLDVGLTAAVCAVFVAGMVAASFAAVPLYRIFCQATGFGGTPRQAEAAPLGVTDQFVTVRFDANVSNGLGWSFRPLQRSLRVRLGEVAQASFFAENRTARPITGTATFNVTPDAAGAYFNKLDCFCFTEQSLAAGQSADLGVTFFVDPAYAADEDLEGVTTITLSYTFFPAATSPSPLAAAVFAKPDSPL